MVIIMTSKNAKKSNTPATAKKSVSLKKTDTQNTDATIAPVAAMETKTPDAPKLGKYGAPAQRPNRTTNTHSEFGNRKWNYRGVTVYNEKTGEFTTDLTQCAKYDKTTAQNILAALLKNPAVANGRLWFAKSKNPDMEIRSVWVALKSDNGIAA